MFRTLTLTFVTACCCIIPHSGQAQEIRQGAYYTEAHGENVLRHYAAEYNNTDEWENKAKRIRRGILSSTSLNIQAKRESPISWISEWREYSDYQVANVSFESTPGFVVTGAIYSPKREKNRKYPGILSPHGHWSKKEDYGRFRDDAQFRAAQLARMGAIVFTYDMLGYGELTERGWVHESPETMKLQLWNSIRSLDFLESLDFVDQNKLAATGASGGATQVILLAAVDDRVKVSVPVVQVSAHFFGGCDGESGMPIHVGFDYETNNVEIAALVAPKPMLLISNGDDWTRNTPRVEYPHIRRIYGFYDAVDRVENLHLPYEKHGYEYSKRIGAYMFLSKHLGLDLNMDESGIVIESMDELRVFSDAHPFPSNLVSSAVELSW